MRKIEKQLEAYYQNNLNNFGLSAKGVGWKNETAQVKRFSQFLRIIERDVPVTINDLGCGIGDFFSFLVEQQYNIKLYLGFDVLTCMIKSASERFAELDNAQFYLINDAKELQVNDYTFASGIFNLKYTASSELWLNYILETIGLMYKFSKKGIGFNMLTKYSDKALMQDHLFYGDPLYFFDYCKKNFSRNVALLHDYDEYDFTILIRK